MLFLFILKIFGCLCNLSLRSIILIISLVRIEVKVINRRHSTESFESHIIVIWSRLLGMDPHY